MVPSWLTLRKRAHDQWSKVKHFCCDSCCICADDCRTSRSTMLLSVIQNTRKNDNPNSSKFNVVVNRILQEF